MTPPLARAIRRLLPMLAVLLAAPVAAAQSLPPATIAVVDFQQVLRESKAAVDVRAKVERQRQIYQKQITREEQDLRSADQELSQQRAILSADAFAQKRRAFEQRVADVQRRVQARKRQLQEASAKALKEVQRAVAAIIADLAKEHGFNLVIPRRQIMFADAALNISDELISRLNKRLPTVDVPLPGK